MTDLAAARVEEATVVRSSGWDAAPRPTNTAVLRPVAAWIVGLWPFGVLVTQVIVGRGSVSAGWFAGWMALLACCAVAALALATLPGFDAGRLDLAAVFAVAYPLFVMTGVPGMNDQYAGTAGATRLVLATVVAFLCVLLGVRCAGVLGRGWSAPAARRSSGLQVLAGLGALVVALGLLGYYLAASGVPPIVLVAQGERGSSLAQARQDAVVALADPIARYGFNFVRLYVLPLSSAALIVHWRRRRTWGAAIRAAIVTALALFAAAMTLEKSPVVRLVLVILLSLLVGTGLRLRLRWIVPMVAVALFFPLLVLSLGNPDSSFLVIAKLFGDRIFIDPARVLYHYFQWAPEESHGFLGGRLLPYVGSRAGAEVRVTEIISDRIFPGADVQGNANAAFVGNLWVDFGWFGVLIGSLLTGLAIGLMQRVVDTVRRTPLGAAMTGLLCLQVVFLVQISLFDAVLSLGLGVVDVLVFCVVWVRFLAPSRRGSTGA